MVLSSSQMRREWAEYECTTKDWATIEFLGRSPVKTIKRLVDAWSAAERVLIDSGYGAASIVGSYACRDVRDGANRSLHAYRLALDIDPAANSRQGKGAKMDWGKCRITVGQVRAVEAIRTRSGAQVFRNGHIFKNPDPMHFQIVCTKADIDTGVDWSTVAGFEGPSETGVTVTEEFTMYCKFDDGVATTNGDETVKHWQTKLTALGFDTGGTDGRYGDMTKAAVQAIAGGSDGMAIGGVESAEIDVALAKLGPAAKGGVEHQHDEYAPAVHEHPGTG